MPAGIWRLSPGDFIVLAGIVALFIDLLKSTSTSMAAVVNHALSIGLFIVGLIVFLLLPPFVTAPFFMLLAMVFSTSSQVSR